MCSSDLRAARAISLELDGELSEIGRRRLSRHLASCASCAAKRDELADLTAAIRALPAAQSNGLPAHHVFTPIPGMPYRQKRLFAGVLCASAAAAVAAAPISVTGQGAPTWAEQQLEHRVTFAELQHVRAERDLTRS